MRADPVITSLEMLYENAKLNVTTKQRQELVLMYGRSLIKRLEIENDRAEEIKIALALRSPPVFGFIASEACVVVESKAVVRLNGSCENIHALCGGVI
jgi:hypothetical protein